MSKRITKKARREAASRALRGASNALWGWHAGIVRLRICEALGMLGVEESPGETDARFLTEPSAWEVARHCRNAVDWLATSDFEGIKAFSDEVGDEHAVMCLRNALAAIRPRRKR